MINIEETKLGQSVKMTELYDYLGLDKSQYSRFIKKELIENPYLENEKDYSTLMSSNKIAGKRGQFRQEFIINIDAAKKICLISRSKKGNEIREELIRLSNKVENLELMTVKQASFAVKVINCLKYIENQKEAYKMHQTKFTAENLDIQNGKFIYAEFAKYRTSITGWDKSKVDEAISLYLDTHSGYNRTKVDKSNMQTKLSIIDIGEAVRVACIDILYSKNTDGNLAENFARLCKNLANEMKIQSEKKNENNLFHEKQALDSIDTIKIDKL